MTTSKKLAEKKVAKFEKKKRGLGAMTSKKIRMEHYILGVFVVAVVGSFLVHIVRLALMG